MTPGAAVLVKERARVTARRRPPLSSISSFRPTKEIDEAAADERHAALSYLDDAWVEAMRDGLDEDCMVHAALFTALRRLVSTYGEEACADYVESLSARIRAGEYTVIGARQ